MPKCRSAGITSKLSAKFTDWCYRLEEEDERHEDFSGSASAMASTHSPAADKKVMEKALPMACVELPIKP